MDITYRFDPYAPLSRPASADAETAIRTLHEGNARFVQIVEQVRKEVLGGATHQTIVIPTDPLSLAVPLWNGEAPKQAPFAVVLGCSDARAPVEVIFDQGCNALFVVRVAGNVLGVECLASINYAVRHLGSGLNLIVVLGHTGCGAVTAAVDMYLSPGNYAEIAVTHALRSLVDRMTVAVRGAAKALERSFGHAVSHSPGFRNSLLETAVYMNAAVTAFDVKRELAGMGDEAPQVVYGVYDLVSQRVRPLPEDKSGKDAAESLCFRDAPQHADDLHELETQVVQRIRGRAGV